MKILRLILIPLLTGSVAIAQSNELIPYFANDKYGYSDQKGKIVIQPAFASADFFTHGFARVFLPLLEMGKDGPNVCFINNKGQNIFKDTFQNASSFFDLLIEEKPGIFYKQPVAQIVKAGKSLLLSPKGKIITSKAFRFNEFQETTVEKYVDFKYRILHNEDYTQRGIAVDSGIILVPVYDDITVIDLNKRIFIVKKDGKEGLLNQAIRNDIQWHESIYLIGRKDVPRNEYAFIYKANNKEGIIDEKGQVLLPTVYDRITPLDSYDDMKVTIETYINEKLISGLYDAKLKKQLLAQEYISIERTHLPSIYKVKKLFGKKEIEFYVNTNGIKYMKTD